MGNLPYAVYAARISALRCNGRHQRNAQGYGTLGDCNDKRACRCLRVQNGLGQPYIQFR